MPEIIFSPSDFVAVFNQTIEYAYPLVVIEGELANFRIAKNRWVYFSLKDEAASVDFFGSVYKLPGPLEDGLKVRVVGAPRLHPQFGFTINFEAITPVGEGALKKAADLLTKKLQAEGLFAPERKRLLPVVPQRIAFITAANSAAYSDFIKILNERWGGIEVYFHDSYMQGEQAPAQIISAIDYFNQLPELPDILVLTRGGGSADDLAAFNDERVVRAVAASRIPTLVAVGHEIDISLAELAADQRASTPSNAAQIAVPDKHNIISHLAGDLKKLEMQLLTSYENQINITQDAAKFLQQRLKEVLAAEKTQLSANRKLIKVFDPYAALKRGYAIISKNSRHVYSVKHVKRGDKLSIELADGKMMAKAEG